MKKFCLTLTVLVILVIGLGFYRGWFAVSGGREGESQNVDVKPTVDTDKVKADAGMLKQDPPEVK